MNKKFILSIVALFVVSMILGFVIHGMLLGSDYTALGSMMRSEEDQMAHFGWMLFAHVVMSVGLTGIYRRGIDANRPWLGQGVRFGLWLALVMTVPIYLIYYAVQPLPFALVAKQICFDTVGLVLLGITVAAVNK